MPDPMPRKRVQRGVSSVEFAFSMLVMVPLVLGTGAIGINMIKTLQIVQIARDAGHMFAKGLDFSQPGNLTTLADLGSDLGLDVTADQGKVLVLLTALTFVDKPTCASVGAVDGSGNPTGACTNYNHWVFTQRVVIGNSHLHDSNLGTPLTSGPTGVSIDPTTGRIPVNDYVTKAGAVANFTGINPYSVINGNITGLPPGQMLYIAEASALAFQMPPFTTNARTYAFAMF